MRCGTSWLFHYLSQAPEVTVSPLKELHFFNAKFPVNALSDMDALSVKRLGVHVARVGNPTDNVRHSPAFQASIDRVQMIYDDNAYFGHFARLCTAQTRTLCDITPAYSVIGQAGFQYMKTFFATQAVSLKFVFVLRDPLDRLWSQLRHMQEINPEVRIAERWQAAIKSPLVCARANYRETVSLLDASYPPDDILYLFYENLFTEPALSRLCRFADADYRPGETSVRQNDTTVELDLPDDARQAFLRLLEPQYAFCRQRFGDLIPASWAA